MDIRCPPEAFPATYRIHGCALVEGLLDPADLAPVRAEIAAEIDRRALALHAAGRLSELHTAAPFATRFGLLVAQCPEMEKDLDIANLLPRSVHELMHHPRLLAMLAGVLGSEIDANPIQHLRSKPPHDISSSAYFAVPWHQDSAVTTEDADATEIVTVWQPLLRADAEMGCVQVIPGAHRLGHLPHVEGTRIADRAMPATAPVSCTMRAGDVLVMSRFCPHNSTPNRSRDCRWSLDLRFQPAGTPSGRAWYPSLQVASVHPGRVARNHAAWVASWRAALARPNPGCKHRVVAETP